MSMPSQSNVTSPPPQILFIKENGLPQIGEYKNERVTLSLAVGKDHLMSKDLVTSISLLIHKNPHLKAVTLLGWTFNQLSHEDFTPLIEAIRSHAAIHLLCFSKNLLTEQQQEQLCVLTNSNVKKGMRLLDDNGIKFGSAYTDWTLYRDSVREATRNSIKYLGGMTKTTGIALTHFKEKTGRPPHFIVDFGASEGRDSINLLKEGCPKICAIDGNSDALHTLSHNVPSGLEGRISYFDKGFILYKPAEPVEMLVSSFTWPYRPSADFPACWKKCVEMVLKGGLICGHFFGPKKDKLDPAMTYHTESEARALLERDFTILHFEAEGTKIFGGNDQPWGNLYHIVAEKK